jgi:hypothetical protein
MHILSLKNFHWCYYKKNINNIHVLYLKYYIFFEIVEVLRLLSQQPYMVP